MKNTMNREAEFESIMSYIKQSHSDGDTCRDRICTMWTAYCVRNGLTAYTPDYNSDSKKLWENMDADTLNSTGWFAYQDFRTDLTGHLFNCEYSEWNARRESANSQNMDAVLETCRLSLLNKLDTALA